MTLHARLRQREFANPAQQGIVALLVAAGHVGQAFEEVCGRHGITHGQYNVLRILRGAHPQGHPRGEIAARLINRAPDLTRLIDRLEQRRLVERVRSDEDRRLSVSRITRKGMRLLEVIEPELVEVHERLTAGLSAAELRTLAAGGDRIIEAAGS